MADSPDFLPLFPLQTVLFPDGVLPLKVFEARYMDMVSECLRTDALFGVVLIEQGQETGAPALPHALGTAAVIANWDMAQAGVLNIVARGTRRFRILERSVESQGLQRARVEWLAERNEAVPPQLAELVPLMQAIAEDAGEERLPPPHRYDDAAWLGYRYAEVLPISMRARQKLLELDDAVSRLEIMQQYLVQHGLLKRAP
jgi:Lon protease-like protein